MATAPQREPYRFTIAEYLAFENLAADRHEYCDGTIYAMAGESEAHADITANVGGMLQQALRGTPCRVRVKDTKVRSAPAETDERRGLFSYPDLVVICGRPQMMPEHLDVLDNPRIILEVLSPSTEAFDRGEKRERYFQHLQSLEEYLLIAQDHPAIEHWRKDPDGLWHSIEVAGLHASVRLASIGVTLALAEVYERVEFF